ncbi:MAG: squalene/phytoene synthase family protein [Anaerolineae bacterium]|nr:squalene/phytoene synthase family protein [Anaerolineae bacterium]
MSTGYVHSEMIGDSRLYRQSLASEITWKASKQTYYTVLFLTDRTRMADAYRAYAYFRWVDDLIDESGMDAAGRIAFVERQSSLVERLYRGEQPQDLCTEERLLADLIRHDHEPGSGLQSYICHMMAVMAFDTERRGRLISEGELSNYTRWLAIAVTEAMHYFIGNRCGSPQNEMRYLAATGAHITHMLRDALDDIAQGYINIPREAVEAAGVDLEDGNSPAFRAWVKGRVELAYCCFRAGRNYLEQVENPRCRLAGYAYIARFESVLDMIERDGYRLRASYPECKTLQPGLKMGLSSLWQTICPQPTFPVLHHISTTEGARS